MKKSMYLLVLVFLLFVACGGADVEPYVEDYYEIIEEESYYTPEPYNPHYYDVFTSGRTRGEYLYDLDFLYNTLRENFPFFGAALRTHGVDMHARYLEAREHIENRDDFRTDEYFMATLNNFFVRQARQMGHLAILPREVVLYHIQLNTYHIDQGDIWVKPLLEEFNNPATRAFYNLTDEDFLPPQHGVESAVYATSSDNVLTYIIEEGRIAYVGIATMSYMFRKLDSITLLDFFHQVADYDHLIIDIRNNPGGDSSFFIDLVVSPNISQPLYSESNVFLMGGEHSRWVMDAGFVDENFGAIDHDVIANMPYFRHESLDFLNYHLRRSYYVEPSHGDGIFGGKIWLLVNGSAFSASEYAASFARHTGFATLVGETTGGGGRGFLIPYLALPNTGIVLRYTIGYGVDMYGRESYEHGTDPHYFNRPGMDALQTVLAMIEEGLY